MLPFSPKPNNDPAHASAFPPHLLNTVALLSKEFDATNVRLLDASGTNEVLYFEAGGTPLLTKTLATTMAIGTHRETHNSREAHILELLEQAKTEHGPSPVHIPFAISKTSEFPVNIIEYIPGVVPPETALRQFSAEEQTKLGHTIGLFVAWLGSALPVTHPSVRIPYLDRAEILRTEWPPHEAERLDDFGLHTLALHLDEVRKQYSMLRCNGYNSRTIIGHDDLRPANWVLNETNGLQAIIDFELLRPSCPEREFRHLRRLGTIVVEAALESYESAAGQAIDPERILMWERIQIATMAGWAALRGFPADNRQLLRQRLELSWPNTDWSEITFSEDLEESTKDS